MKKIKVQNKVYIIILRNLIAKSTLTNAECIFMMMYWGLIIISY